MICAYTRGGEQAAHPVERLASHVIDPAPGRSVGNAFGIEKCLSKWSRGIRKLKIMAEKLISVVDDDESVRESLEGLLRSMGYAAETFASAEHFLQSEAPRDSDCLILDVSMPGMSGPDLQRALLAQQRMLPIIFITAHEDDAVASRVLADGAVGYLLKPFSEASLMEALSRATMP